MLTNTVLGRVVVVGIVGALLAVGAADAELWPMSSMRLFSQVRTDRAAGYEVFLVDADGAARRLDVASLGREFRGAHHLLPRFADMTQDERDEVCAAWATAAGGAASVRIDRVVRSVPTGADDPRRELDRRVAWTCSA